MKEDWAPSNETECKEWGGTWHPSADGKSGVCVRDKKEPNKAVTEMAISRNYPCQESAIVINITRLSQPVEQPATQKKPG